MFDSFMPTVKGLFGNITVRTVGNRILVDGVRSQFIQQDLKKLFGTTRVSEHLIDIRSRHSFSIHEFFLPDFIHCIDSIIESGKLYKIPYRTFFKIREEIVENTWVKHVYDENVPNRLDESALSLFYKSPLDYQSEFFKYYNDTTWKFRLNGALFAASAGSGKTLSALMLMEQLSCDKVFIVTPKNAIESVWAKSIRNEFKNSPKYWTSESSSEVFDSSTKYFLIHYDYLTKFIKEILPKIQYNHHGIILDESHNFNEEKSARTGHFVNFCIDTKCEDVLWLSGTPIKALAVEAIPLIRCVDHSFDEYAQEKYKKIFKGDNTKAVTILNNRIGMVSFKVPKDRLKLSAPVFNNLPVKFDGSEEYTLESIKRQMKAFIEERMIYYRSRSKEDHEFFYSILDEFEKKLSKKQLESYMEYRRNLKTIISSSATGCKDEMLYCNRYEKTEIIPSLSKEDRDRFKEIKTIVKYLHLKIQGECLGRVVGRARINVHVEMCKHIDYSSIIETTEKKTVVFTSYVEVIERALSVMRNMELNPAAVFAKTNNRLAEIVALFENDPSINPLIATYASLSTAVPLTMADTMIIIDTPYRDYVLQQSVSRIHRLGMTTIPTVYTCVLDTGDKPNISTRNIDILKWSQEQVQAITGVKSPYMLEDDEAGNDRLALESFVDNFNTAIEHFNLAIEGQVNEIVTSKPRYLNW